MSEHIYPIMVDAFQVQGSSQVTEYRAVTENWLLLCSCFGFDILLQFCLVWLEFEGSHR